MEFIWLWLGVMFPLVFSPGPANIVFATSGAAVGLKRSLPLLCGIDSVFILQSAFIGLGADAVLEKHPAILQSLQLFGALYLVFLAAGFLKKNSPTEQTTAQALRFIDGAIIQILNAKGWVMVILMHSLFSIPAQDIFGSASVIMLVLMLAILNISLHLVWIKLGATLQIFMKGEKRQRYQNVIYACSLLYVAALLLIDNSIWR